MSLLSRIIKHKFAYFLILPSILYLLIFQIYPLFENLRLSFTDFILILPDWKYIGIDNYKHLLFEDERFWLIVRNSFYWIGFSLVFQLGIGLMAALILNGKIVGRGFWRGITMVPWVMPVAVVGIMMKWIGDYNHGLINYYLQSIGLLSENIDWFGNREVVWVSLIASASWKGFAYPTVMFLAGLQGIPAELYEASKVDGAGRIQNFLYITLPLLMPVILVTGIVQIITGWNKFEMIWVLTGGGPGYETSILPTYIYTTSYSHYKMGLGSAVAVISSVIVFVFIFVYYKLLGSRKEVSL